jgi:uncharacterized RDD family membrane protein YckC
MENEYSIFPEKEPVFYAKFWSRFWATVIDAILISIVDRIISNIMGYGTTTTYTRNNYSYQVSQVSVNLSFSIVAYLYYSIMESSAWQATLGKRFMQLEVTNMEGGKLTFVQATIRFWSKLISIIILFIGYFMNIWDPKGQTLHDKLANALVIKK